MGKILASFVRIMQRMPKPCAHIFSRAESYLCESFCLFPSLLLKQGSASSHLFCVQQREYQLTGDAPHQRERDEQIAKFRYSLEKKSDGLRYSLNEKPDDPSVADAVVEFVPVDFADKTSEGDTPQPFKEVSGEKSASEEAVGGKITDAAAAQLAINGGKSGRINKLNFTPVDLSRANKTGLVQQILSNDIPALDLMPGADMFFNSTSDKFISFLPVEVTRRKAKGGIRRQRLKSYKKMKEKEEELMKLLMAVENMNAADTRATIIARNREKRRRRKERREREKLKVERLKRQKKKMLKKENSVLPPDGFHASNSQKNFMKKKYYSRWGSGSALSISTVSGSLRS